MVESLHAERPVQGLRRGQHPEFARLGGFRTTGMTGRERLRF